MNLLLTIPLALIAYEDFKYRAIHWLWIVLFSIGVFTLTPFNFSTGMKNCLLLLFQLIILVVYLRIKYKKRINLTQDYLGLGDILLLIPIAFIFDTTSFLLFLSLSFCLSIVCFYLANHYLSTKSTTIPLAAYLSIFLVAYLFWTNIITP